MWYCAMHDLYYDGDLCPKCANGSIHPRRTLMRLWASGG